MHVDNFIFILLVLVAMLFQLLTRLATKPGKRTREDGGRPTSPRPPQRSPRAPAETEEDRVRKFLEALGQPTTSKPPAPVAPRPTYQKPVVFPRVPSPMKSPLPPLTTRPPESKPDWPLPREIRLPGQIPVTKEAKIFRPRIVETPVFEVQAGPPPEPLPIPKTAAEAYAAATKPLGQAAEAKLNLASLLSSPAGLRDAIILREIFGPPRSLQPFDLAGTI
jgi:hypothetical protein